MEPVNLFDLATRQSQWLAVRQSAIASNIANVNTPGYTANDVEPFEKVLNLVRTDYVEKPSDRELIAAATRSMVRWVPARSIPFTL